MAMAAQKFSAALLTGAKISRPAYALLTLVYVSLATHSSNPNLRS